MVADERVPSSQLLLMCRAYIIIANKKEVGAAPRKKPLQVQDSGKPPPKGERREGVGGRSNRVAVQAHRPPLSSPHA